MSLSCDVLVVGAGIVGSSVAYELARRGADVILADRGRVGGGSSGLNAGGVRTQFRQETNIRFAARTVARMEGLREELGDEIALRRTGYLLLYGQAESGTALAAAAAEQNRVDLPTRLVAPNEIAELVPGIRIDDLAGAAYSPDDGYIDPRATVAAFAGAAARAGARVMEGAEITGVEVSGDRVVEVTVGQDAVAVGVLVNCCGVWAPVVAELYGDGLPIVAYRSQAFLLDRTLAVARLTPLVIDYDHGVYFHSEGRGLLFGGEEPTEYPDRPRTVEPDPAWTREAQHRLIHRVPELHDARVIHGWAGLIEITPDSNPIVGWSGAANAYTVAGFSGHGMCLAPGLAPEVAREVLGERPTLPLDIYRPDRFRRGMAWPETLWGSTRDYGIGTHGEP